MQVKDCYQDGQLFFGKGLYDKALASLHKAYTINKELGKDDYSLNLLIARTFYAQKDYARAKRIFNDLVEQNPDDENTKLYLAYTYYYTKGKASNLVVSENLVDCVLKINDKNINALELRADISMYNKDYTAAMENYEKIKDGSSNLYRIIFKEAICHYYLNNASETLRLCSQLFEAGFKKHPSVKRLYETAKGKRKQVFTNEFGKMSWTQKLFAFLFDPYVDRALSLQADADRRVDFAKRALYTDKLTGINNRRCFDDLVKSGLNGQGQPLTLLSFDVDKFKTFNDTYGHDLGDVVLIQYSKIGNEVFGSNFYRYGGEEYLATVKGSILQAALVAEKFRKVVEEELAERVNKIKGTMINKITCSGGLAEYPREAATFELLYSLADKRLYGAKNSGRNKVISEGTGLPAELPAGDKNNIVKKPLCEHTFKTYNAENEICTKCEFMRKIANAS
jgi:diguanylate cyclase (GGDEF)-like protein